MGEIVSELSDIVVLTAEDSQSEAVNDIINQIKLGISEEFRMVYEIPNRKTAIKFAIESAKKR